MRRALPALWVVGLLTTFALASFSESQQPVPPTNLEQDPLVIEPRGPLHEAYAQPLEAQPQPSTPVPKSPPPMIPEEPPEQRPEAEDAQWIPGYWAWDSERQDYLWISGVYRVAPQGRTFVPGYWTETPEGWRWVAGFWAPTQQSDLPYTPQPPAPLDTDGPNMPAPDDNSLYIPGVWVYGNSRFAWRPGYYAPVRAGRLWISPHYSWTPNGYMFIDGYWDYPLENRGLVFAPVYFRQPLWRTAGWSYRPNYVVSIGLFFDTGFIRAGSGHFYFGNYYGANYARLGYNPWYTGRGRYDPTFAYNGWQNNRGNPNWIAGAQRTYAGRVAGTIAAPPTTLAQQNAIVAGNAKAPRAIAPLNQASTLNNSVRLVNASATHVAAQRGFAQHSREISETRSRLDAASIASKSGSSRSGEARSFNLPSVLQTKSSPQVLTSPGEGRLIGKEARPTPKDAPSSGPLIINGSQRSDGPAFKGNQPKGEIRNQPPAQPKFVQPQPQPQPRIINPPTPQPKIVQPQPQPRIVNPPPAPPKIVQPQPQPQPRVVNPPPAPPRIVQPQPQPQPRVVNPPPRVQPAPQPQPRVQPAPQPPPRVQSPPPRVQAPPAPRSSPPPTKNSPPSRPPSGKKR